MKDVQVLKYPSIIVGEKLFTSKIPSFSVALTHSSLYSSILGESTCKSLISQNVSRFWSLIKFVSPYPYCPQVAWGSRCCCSGRPRGSMSAWSNSLGGLQWALCWRSFRISVITSKAPFLPVGRVRLPKWMVFRKNSKLPSLSENVRKSPVLRSKICNIGLWI